VPDGSLSVVPCQPDRDVIYCFGKSGSGKSIWVGNWIAEYQLKFPTNQVFLFSEKNEDPAFEGLKFRQVPLSDLWDPANKMQSHLSVADFPDDCLVVFDDIDALKPKRLAESVQGTIDNLLVNGRSHHISVLIASHLGSDYKRTRYFRDTRSLNRCNMC
jgi:hypothetical protein